MIEKLKNDNFLVDIKPSTDIKQFFNMVKIILEHELKINEIIDYINSEDDRAAQATRSKRRSNEGKINER